MDLPSSDPIQKILSALLRRNFRRVFCYYSLAFGISNNLIPHTIDKIFVFGDNINCSAHRKFRRKQCRVAPEPKNRIPW